MLLERLLKELFKRGHKVLLFSQFTKSLDIIEDWAVDFMDWNICRIDGMTKQDDRRALLKDFNEGTGPDCTSPLDCAFASPLLTNVNLLLITDLSCKAVSALYASWRCRHQSHWRRYGHPLRQRLEPANGSTSNGPGASTRADEARARLPAHLHQHHRRPNARACYQ